MVKGFRPPNLEELLKIRKEQEADIIAGGTDIMVRRARGTGISPKFSQDVLFINHLPELSKIELCENELQIGSCASMSRIMNFSAEKLPIFARILKEIASKPTRNIATLGGNICNASPAGDSLPFLYAVDAMLEIQSLETTRKIYIKDFITAPGRTLLEKNEILTKIIIPLNQLEKGYYKKVGTRRGMALSKLSFLGMHKINDNKIEDIRIAFGAVAPTVVRSKKIENQLIGLKIDELQANSADIISQYTELINPIDDSRSTRKYRLNAALNLLKEYLVKIERI